MREYRGKRIDNGEWVAGHYLTRRTNDHGLQHMISVQDMWGFHEIDPDTVGQSTGLQDKNGARIFEGDVVKYLSREQTGTRVSYKRRGYDTYAIHSEIEIIGHIKLGLYESSLNGKLMTYIVDTDQVTRYESYFWGEGKRSDRPKIVTNSLVKALNANKEYEVIGNRWDHPHLLGEDEKG